MVYNNFKLLQIKFQIRNQNRPWARKNTISLNWSKIRIRETLRTTNASKVCWKKPSKSAFYAVKMCSSRYMTRRRNECCITLIILSWTLLVSLIKSSRGSSSIILITNRWVVIIKIGANLNCCLRSAIRNSWKKSGVRDELQQLGTFKVRWNKFQNKKYNKLFLRTK